MRFHARISILTLAATVLVAVSVPAAAQAAFGVEKFFAANCKAAFETCNKAEGTPAEEKAKAELEGFTQAAGHPNWGITDFKINTIGEAPTGIVTHVRTDVAPGVSTNPEAVPKCTMAEFEGIEVAKGIFTPPACSPESEIGTNTVVVFTGKDTTLTGKVYNLVQPKGRSSMFGVALGAAPLGAPAGTVVHTLIEGNVEWGKEGNGTNKGDYHDYFEINVSPAIPLISSRLVFKGNIGKFGFLTNPTSCTGVGPQTTTTLHLTEKEGPPVEATYTTPVGTENCGIVPFAPSFGLSPETTQSDQPDGITTELSLPHDENPAKLDSSQLKTASVTLPEGMTLNPSAAAGLTACTPSQARITSEKQGVDCPGSSKIGTVTLNVPGLPSGSLTGNLYLGGPESGPITGPPYNMYIDAESERYGISVRLKGSATPNPTTGRVTASFTENPEQPFSNLVLKFNGGALAPIANPLNCGTATTQTSLTPFTGTAAQSPTSSFIVDSNGKGGSCSSPLPFAPSQSTANQSGNAGGHTSYTFNLTRNNGEQYLSGVWSVLPAGLVGAIPTVTQCTEAQAFANACPATSQIGSATAISGSGPTPFTFGNGAVYLTGPYNGAPFGLSIVVPAVAGPFNLGPVITRATISVDPNEARVIVKSVLPRIVGGIPIRLRGINVAINKQGFLFNPTNCGPLATESLFTSTLGGTHSASSPFQVANCNALAFKPSFKAKASGRTSRENGASFETTINQPAGQANMRSVVVTLPKQLPSRQSTLKQACPEATFAANPYLCPKGSFVGGVRANTPTLPGKMKGPAIFVSHGGAAFPDLDLVLEANGVRVVVKGNTAIKNGITTTSFLTNPDVPVSSVTVNLPVGSHSALGATANLCTTALYMPTVITGQNGGVVKQRTKISVGNCGVQVVGARAVGSTAYLTVKTFAAGRISGGGSGLATVYRRLSGASNATSLRVPLTGSGRRRGRPFRARVRVGFVAKRGPSSVAFVTVTFR
jgi:hypothetical protein